MKRIISVTLVLSLLLTTVNISFAAEVDQGDIYSYDTKSANNISKISELIKNSGKTADINIAEESDDTSCIPSKEQLLVGTDETPALFSSEEKTRAEIPAVSSTGFTFNANLLTKFNTITGPKIGNGANEPKFSYNSFMEENISDYSGELTLNFEDLVLDGRNGLDLRIGRTYQTVASSIGEKTLMILPNSNGYLRNNLVNNYSTYLLDRYNLGMGWGFSFPSVQVETEYIPQEVVDTYYYDEETELYYHSGNGEVYQVQFTSDTTDSNLKGYYGKDIQFNKNDTGYSNGQITSYYSMTLEDKTKQYFAKDGRLIGIVDRFGNTIKFEHELDNITNRVPEGNFRYDDDMWTTSTSSTGTYDAIQIEDADIGSNDGYVMYFRRDNEEGNDTYIASQPIQVKPLTDYNLGIRIKSQYEPDVKVEIIGYDTAYNYCHTRTYWITDYGTDWYDFNQTFSMSSAVRYVIIKITPDYAYKTYIDNITLDEQKPLLKTITDSVGRVVTFDYSGDLTAGGSATGAVSLTVVSPDGATTRTLTYNKEVIEFVTEYLEHDEQRLYWYLNSSATEGTDGATVKYTYEGGTTKNEDGTLAYPPLYLRYDTKTHSASDGWINKPVLSSVRYKDRKKIYEYETVRKHLGDDGYYDTLRVKKKYDMYTYVPEGETKSYFKGELGTVNYTYGGMYNGNSFYNETGYPSYTFDDETTLNEQWTVTKTGKTTDTVIFSNCAVVKQTSSFGDVSVTSDYTNHETFKNSPVQIKNTVAEDGETNETYFIYSYNDWGGLASETKEVDDTIKNNPSLLEKYTTTYQYNDFHYITKKDYYNNLDSPQVSEINTFDANGLLTSSKNAVGEKTYYHYENAAYPFLVTKTTLDDPMRFHNVLGGDRIVTYTYDTYGLYPITISESYDSGTSDTSYVYDYITGDILKETYPDGSHTQYIYYSDGKVNLMVSPSMLSVDGRYLYTIEQHIYNSNAILEGYGDETPTYDVEQIIKYVVYTDEETATPYILDINYYDAVGNLKQAQQGYYKADDTSGAYLKSTTQYYHDTYDRLIKTVDNEDNAIVYTYDGFDRPVSVTDSENNVYRYAYNSVQNKVDLTLNGATETTTRHLMTQTFDLYGNVTENVVYPNNASETLNETYEYDLNNNTI